MKTLIMQLTNGGERKVTIPEDWKVTFGPLVPHSGRHSFNSSTPSIALRLYCGKDQKAVFIDVISFRDESLQITESIPPNIPVRGTRITGT